MEFTNFPTDRTLQSSLETCRSPQARGWAVEEGYLLGGEWTSGKPETVLSRLAVDLTGWDRNAQK